MSKDLILTLEVYEEQEHLEDFMNTMDQAIICMAEKHQKEEIPHYEEYVWCLVSIQKSLRKKLIEHLQKSPQ